LAIAELLNASRPEKPYFPGAGYWRRRSKFTTGVERCQKGEACFDEPTWLADEPMYELFPDRPSDVDPQVQVIPHFSSRLEDALLLVRWISREEHVKTTLTFCSQDEDKSLDSANVTMDAGDCNCPHGKEYDKRDGHGWSYFEDYSGDTEAHAICLCFLEIVPVLAKGREINKPIPGSERASA
jgi:hypothetical protein